VLRRSSVPARLAPFTGGRALMGAGIRRLGNGECVVNLRDPFVLFRRSLVLVCGRQVGFLGALVRLFCFLLGASCIARGDGQAVDESSMPLVEFIGTLSGSFASAGRVPHGLLTFSIVRNRSAVADIYQFPPEVGVRQTLNEPC
jgi:hypothetical protein